MQYCYLCELLMQWLGKEASKIPANVSNKAWIHERTHGAFQRQTFPSEHPPNGRWTPCGYHDSGRGWAWRICFSHHFPFPPISLPPFLSQTWLIYQGSSLVKWSSFFLPIFLLWNFSYWILGDPSLGFLLLSPPTTFHPQSPGASADEIWLIDTQEEKKGLVHI